MMYLKLALDNIRKNSRTYLPYLISNIVTFAMLYIMNSMSGNPMLFAIRGGHVVAEMMDFGKYIMYFFTTLFVIYTSNFISKQRRKEFGLFSILGMEKRHITKVILFENFFTVLLTILFGTALGVLFDKIAFLIMIKILGEAVILGFYFSTFSLIFNSIFIAVLFLGISMISVIRVRISNPLELMQSSRTGEREPKARWLLAILAVVCIAAGYYLSVFTTDVREDVKNFFIAVLLVIAGTYFLFTAGTIAVLKLMKKNRGFYYKTKHFVSVSSMMYRMKQNALGLASICVLSTMVLVMISTTISLLVGINDSVEKTHPFDINISSDHEDLDDLIDSFLEENNIELSESLRFEEVTFYAELNGDSAFEYMDWGEHSNAKWLVWIIPQSYYNYFSHGDVSLEKDEALYFDRTGTLELDHFSILGREFKKAKKFKRLETESHNYFAQTIIVVVKDDEVIHEVVKDQQNSTEGNYTPGKDYFFSFTDKTIDCSELMSDFFKYKATIESENGVPHITFMYSVKDEIRHQNLETFGSLFFIGIFLGALFIMETILIIYYKQISEGLDDKKRFEIMQKVGMTAAEVKSSIGSQVLTVFFMPLILAGVHTGFAFPILYRLLQLNGLQNMELFIFTTVCVFLGFALIYGIIYWLTAKVYYRIVRT